MELGLVNLLTAALLAATCSIITALVLSSRVNWLYEFVLGFAMRGKIMQPSSSSSRFAVPQKFSLHFDILAVIWTSILLVITWFYAHEVAPLICNPSQYSIILSHLIGVSNSFSLHRSFSGMEKVEYKVWQSVFLLLLMEVQVLRRLLETLYIFKYVPKNTPSARMHLFGYLADIFFYTAAPLSLCSKFAPDAFKLVAEEVAKLIVRGKDHVMALVPQSEFDWCVFVSPLIFFYGWFHQLRCHSILGSLRKNPGEARDYAEIIIYVGFLVASGGTDLTICLLLGFVVANLVIVASETHMVSPKNRELP